MMSWISEMDTWVIWLIVVAVLLLVEMMTLTFYLLWISIGSLVGLFISLLLPEAYLLQIGVAAIISLILTMFTKPLSQRLRTSQGFKDEGTELIGKQGVTIEAIPQGGYGIVKVGGDTWSATSTQAIGKDQFVRVVHRSSTIIEVQRWEEII
ncbi:membrane protein implicated in regulation of membrane protease activity [Paenibacillus turicensis]|uniref:Membrane protein implicated in regulation of membrane protease activity n=1 Tax=Paenibacillus turicensis TaxID=160487 RepID=A0ABS4FU39_9BACL|nr:NfeD family protein [Paenibacillus turicensis]MBP1906092.1 membrane protein implicated in regulation of membrane protease activity [Paenibacillus turicensis]